MILSKYKRNKTMKFILAVGLILLFVGCTNNQPSPDLSKRVIKTIGEKHYSIPEGTTSSNYAVDSKVIKRYQEFGVSDCKEGDATWEDQQTADAINSVMRNGKKYEGIAIYKKAAAEGRIGCASPLSDKEYKAALKQ